MFKIKVGLKSFQTHLMRKCQNQIGSIICSLKEPHPSLNFLGSKTVFSPTTKKRVIRKTCLHLPVAKETQPFPPLLKRFSFGSDPFKGGASFFFSRNKNQAEAPEHLVPRDGQSKRLPHKFKGKYKPQTTCFPTLVKKITLLRSPHIDKKSREQFEWKRKKKAIFFDLDSAPQTSFLLFVLTHSRFPGVELEIGVQSKTYFA